MHLAINGWFAQELTTGSGQYLHELLRRLPQTGQIEQISLLLPFPHKAHGLSDLHQEWPEVALMRVTIPRLPKMLGKLWWEQVAVPLATHKLRADLLWVPYWAAPLWQPCPVVVTVHDVVQRLLPAYRGGRLQQLYTALVSHTARRAAAVITVSNAAATDIRQELLLPADRVQVVYNGLSDQQPRSVAGDQQQTVRAKYQLSPRFFLYLGGFDVRKNVESILQAYGRYLQQGGDPTVRLVLAGRLPKHDSAFTPDPRRLAHELGLSHQVDFCGYVEEADKVALYSLATAYIFPSHYEGFGLMALEAMQAGTPVVTSAC